MNASLILVSEAFEMGQGRTFTSYPTATLYTTQEVMLFSAQLYFLSFFIYLKKREREREREGEGKRERRDRERERDTKSEAGSRL